MNGKRMNLRRGDFLKFADSCGISRAAAEKMIARLLAEERKLIELCEQSLLPDDMKNVLTELIQNRCAVFLA